MAYFPFKDRQLEFNDPLIVDFPKFFGAVIQVRAQLCAPVELEKAMTGNFPVMRFKINKTKFNVTPYADEIMFDDGTFDVLIQGATSTMYVTIDTQTLLELCEDAQNPPK